MLSVAFRGLILVNWTYKIDTMVSSYMAIGIDAGAVSSVCVAADEVELTESLLSMSSSGSWDVIDGISCVKSYTA